MSRAFVREDRPDTEPLPDLPLSPHPNLVTPRGLAALKARLEAARAELQRLRARPDRLDTLPERAAERDIRYLEARIASAILVDPALHDLTRVAFGLAVTVAGEDGTTRTYEITGEDEADAAAGRIAPHAPLARALLGAGVGDTVEWRRASGVEMLEIVAIERPS